MEFIKYQHLEKFGTTEVEGIEFGECYIFPKIDGSNGSIWFDGKQIQCGSRRRHLTLDYDNQGFYAAMINDERLKKLFAAYPNIRLYGEWLIPHTLKTYTKDAWKKFYVFDVVLGESYLGYDYYKIICEEFNIDYIPPICKIKNPTYERLVSMLDKSTFLVEDGKGAGEGIVVKNYEFVNRFGRVVWAKIVTNDFKAKHSSNQITEVKEKGLVEQDIVDNFVTDTLVEKEYAKIINEDGWRSQYIPRLLSTVFYCLVKEEAWNFVKKYKNPTINFGTLQYITYNKVKELKPELF